MIGHEFALATKRHVLIRKGETALLESAFWRGDEDEADSGDVELALKAGYSMAN
ncbi:MAG TPA: hypothetical protein VGI99_00775 [Gemmataceae bacterium]